MHTHTNSTLIKPASRFCRLQYYLLIPLTISVAHHGNPVVVCTASRAACTPCTTAHGSCPAPLPATAAPASAHSPITHSQSLTTLIYTEFHVNATPAICPSAIATLCVKDGVLLVEVYRMASTEQHKGANAAKDDRCRLPSRSTALDTCSTGARRATQEALPRSICSCRVMMS